MTHNVAYPDWLANLSDCRYDAGEDIDGQMNSEGAGGFPGGVDISEMLFAQMFAGGGGGFGGFPGGSPFGAGSGRRGGGGGGGGRGFSYSQDFGF